MLDSLFNYRCRHGVLLYPDKRETGLLEMANMRIRSRTIYLYDVRTQR